VRVVLDTSILVRATEGSNGPARELLLNVVTGSHTLLLSNEILFEVARVLRYPRMLALHGLSEDRIYDFICFLRDGSELVTLDPLLSVPIRDVHDIIVAQTAVTGDADVICTMDEDFYDSIMIRFFGGLGIVVMDDVALMRRLRASAG
jgi:putative PIN family toxin of toxin-antitoxin system